MTSCLSFAFIESISINMKMMRMRFFAGAIPLILVACSGGNFVKSHSGIQVQVVKNTDTTTIQLEVVTPDIIHVKAFPGSVVNEKRSLVVLDSIAANTEWTIEEAKGKVGLKTEKVTAWVDLSSGGVSFSDASGRTKLAEWSDGGRMFLKNDREPRLKTIRQIFESPDDEALYGLGQHQNDQMNYKGEDVDLTQYNIAVAIPFMVSSKNYGLLWDNYSRTKFGDIRNYEPLSKLNLANDDNDEKALVAKYYNRTSDKEPVVTRNESVIQYENLDELKNLPIEFTPKTGKVIWTGNVESSFWGTHKWLAYSAGYMKLWINDQLVLDSWRQCWNPWINRLKVDMKPGEKIGIKVEWIPDGAESYISLNWLSPADPVEQNRISFYSEAGAAIDYYFINGNNPDEIISGYRTLTGKSQIAPKWAMGFWQSRERYKTQAQLLDVVKEYRKRQIPIDNIVLDWQYWYEDQWGSHDFDLDRFPNPDDMIRELHENLNARIMISVWPKYYEGIEHYRIMDENGWLYKRNIEMRRKDWVGPGYVSTFYDTYSEGARNEFWRQINDKLFSKGVDAWWMDATEPDIHSNVSWDEKKMINGPTAMGSAEEYFNTYSLMQCKGVYEGQRATNPDQRVFVLTRSAFAGQQRYASATWSGDVASRWFDLKAQISAGLNFSLSGIPYWTTDIGGFAVEKRYENQEPAHREEWLELNTRWFQFGAFCPLFRSHGQFPLREIFNLADDQSAWYQSMVYYDKLRYHLMPYVYSLAGATWHRDYTIMRHLIMDFGDDQKVNNIGDQFMFGPAFLVAPVCEFKARSRMVYLPSGTGWYDFYSNVFADGGQSIQVQAPVDRIPLFVREGSIVPWGQEIQYASQPLTEPVTILIYTGANGSFDLYEDEDVNYNYENGACSTIRFRYSESGKKLTIEKCQGEFPGMAGEREFRIVWVDKNTPCSIEKMIQKGKVVKYSGDEMNVVFETQP